MASFLDSIFGAKPEVPPLQPTDPLQELVTLMGGEIKDWPQIEQLSNLYQSYMTQSMNQLIPGFSDILAAGGVDTKDLLTQADPLIKGQLPPDVMDQVLRDSAFTALGSGTLGGPMGTALGARNLGLTSLQLMTEGANLAASGGNAAQRWEQIGQALQLPPSANLYSPQWFSDFMAKQRASQQAIAQQRANVAAAPNPALQALNQWVEQVGGTIVSTLAGGKPGGNYMTSFNPGQYGIGGGTNLPGGLNFGGDNPYSATTGGLNLPGGGNIGGTNIPYLGGDVSTGFGSATGPAAPGFNSPTDAAYWTGNPIAGASNPNQMALDAGAQNYQIPPFLSGNANLFNQSSSPYGSFLQQLVSGG